MLFSSTYLEMCYKVLIVLLILLVLLRIASERYQADGFQADGFQADGFEAPISVVICKAEWCGHCKTAAPEFKKLVDASPIQLDNGKQAKIIMLDADADKDTIGQYKVRGYPTILVNKKEYPGERTYAGVMEYLKAL